MNLLTILANIHLHTVEICFFVPHGQLELFKAVSHFTKDADDKLKRSKRQHTRHNIRKCTITEDSVYLSGQHIYALLKLKAVSLYFHKSGQFSFSYTGENGERRLADFLDALQGLYGVQLDYSSWEPTRISYIEIMVALDVATAQLVAGMFSRDIDKNLTYRNRIYLLATPVVFQINGLRVECELCIYQLAPYLNLTPDFFKLEVRPLKRHQVSSSTSMLMQTLPNDDDSTWFKVALAFAIFIDHLLKGQSTVPIPTEWNSIPLITTGKVPQLLGKWIGQNFARSTEQPEIEQIHNELSFSVEDKHGANGFRYRNGKSFPFGGPNE